MIEVPFSLNQQTELHEYRTLYELGTFVAGRPD